MKNLAEKIRKDFPILQTKVHGRNLVYLDNAATTQKPQVVLDRLMEFYKTESANVHRGAHFLSGQATRLYEEARETVRHFINAKSIDEVVFTKGTTEAINLVAQAWGRANLQPGDEILLSDFEHHSNIVPWQLIAEERGAKIKVAPVGIDSGELDMAAYRRLLTEKVKIVAITACSNTLGTILPLPELIRGARSVGAKILIDAAQIVSFAHVDVATLDCDFLAFSGHKIFAPFGVGVLYGKLDLLNAMPPYQGGGSMISEVSFAKSTYAAAPQRFEAGTPNVGGAIAMAEALKYFDRLDIGWVQEHERNLRQRAIAGLEKIDGVRILPAGMNCAGILSFALAGVHASDIAAILDEQGVAIRSGHHCTQPLLARFAMPATARASFSIYNTDSDVDALIAGVKKAKEILL